MCEPIFITPDDRLQAVCDQAPAGAVIRLSAGVYRQKLVIRTPGLTLEGCGADQTVLIFDDYARKRGADGWEYLTFRSYTAAVCADDVTMRRLSIVNDAGQPETKGQQIALSVLADGFEMEDCRLTSTQDTLFAGPLPDDLIERYRGLFPQELRRNGTFRQRFTRCLIEGNVDFIFGCGEVLFDRCELRSVPDVRPTGYVAAPSHEKRQETGFVFQGCSFTRAPQVPEQSVYLARPWRDYGICRFQDCQYDVHIHPAGFDPWQGTQRDKTARFTEEPKVETRVSWSNKS